jgi:hypothetical protein
MSLKFNATITKGPVLADRDKKRAYDADLGKPSKLAANATVKNQGEVQERLGFGLRSMYRSVLEEPLPDDMLALLDQLDDDADNQDDSPQSEKDSSE